MARLAGSPRSEALKGLCESRAALKDPSRSAGSCNARAYLGKAARIGCLGRANSHVTKSYKQPTAQVILAFPLDLRFPRRRVESSVGLVRLALFRGLLKTLSRLLRTDDN